MTGIEAIPGLRVLGEPQMSVFAFGSDRHSVFAIADVMESFGWHMDRQHHPDCLHVMVTPAHEGITAAFVADLSRAVAAVESNPDIARQGSAAMYGMVGTLPDRGQVNGFLLDMLDSLTTLAPPKAE